MEIYNKPLPTSANIIGSVAGSVIQMMEKIFPKRFFNHVYINTRLVSIERYRRKRKLIGFRTPAISFTPSLIDTQLLERRKDFLEQHNIMYNGADGLSLDGVFHRQSIEFEIKMKLETGQKLIDMLQYLRSTFNFDSKFYLKDYLSMEYIPIECALPAHLLKRIIAVKGWDEYNTNIFQSLNEYLNQGKTDGLYFNAKKNYSTGNNTIMWVYPQNILCTMDGEPTIERGKKGRARDDNYIGFRLVVELNVPISFRMFVEEDKSISEEINKISNLLFLINRKDFLSTDVIKIKQILSNLQTPEATNFYPILLEEKNSRMRYLIQNFVNSDSYEELMNNLSYLVSHEESINFGLELGKLISRYETELDLRKDFSYQYLDDKYPSYFKDFVSRELSFQSTDTTDYPFETSIDITLEEERIYEQNLVIDVNQYDNKNYINSPLNTRYFYYNKIPAYLPLIPEITEAEMLNPNFDYSPFNPKFGLIDFPVEDNRNPNHLNSPYNPLNLNSPFYENNGLLNYPIDDLRNPLNSLNRISPYNTYSPFNPTNLKSPFNSEKGLIDLPLDDLRNPYNKDSFYNPLNEYSNYFPLYDIDIEKNGNFPEFKHKTYFKDLTATDENSVFNKESDYYYKNEKSPFHPRNGLNFYSFSTGVFFIPNYIPNNSEFNVDKKAFKFIEEADSRLLKKYFGNYYKKYENYLQRNTQINIIDELTDIDLSDGKLLYEFRLIEQLQENFLINKYLESMDLKQLDTVPISDLIGKLLNRIEEDDKVTLHFQFNEGMPDYLGSQKLVYYNVFTSDINDTIDTIQLEEELPEVFKKGIKYLKDNVRNVNKDVSIILRARDTAVEECDFSMNFNTYELKIYNPLINMNYFIGIYMETSLLNKINKETLEGK